MLYKLLEAPGYEPKIRPNFPSKFFLSFLLKKVDRAINSAFFVYFDGRHKPRLKSCERILSVDFSFFLKI